MLYDFPAGVVLAVDKGKAAECLSCDTVNCQIEGVKPRIDGKIVIQADILLDDHALGLFLQEAVEIVDDRRRCFADFVRHSGQQNGVLRVERRDFLRVQCLKRGAPDFQAFRDFGARFERFLCWFD